MIFSLLPPTFFTASKPRGANASNTLFHIRVWKGAPCWVAIYAQERFEWGYRMKRAFIFYSARKMQILSHEIEVQAAVLLYGEDEGAYRSKEAAQMTGYDELYGLSAEEIEQAMIAERWDALDWVRDHEPLLRRAAK